MFDVVGMALAEDCADPVVIDLTNYVAVHPEHGSATFNLIALDLFSKGGGYCMATDNSSFWEDVSTNRPVRFAFDITAFFSGVTVTSEAKSVTFLNGAPHIIEASFLSVMDAIKRVTVMFTNNFDGTTNITVAVETLTLPGA